MFCMWLSGVDRKGYTPSRRLDGLPVYRERLPSSYNPRIRVLPCCSRVFQPTKFSSRGHAGFLIFEQQLARLIANAWPKHPAGRALFLYSTSSSARVRLASATAPEGV